jgi:ubiquinone/menaquinone biosynthesis C-methylase UbiE
MGNNKNIQPDNDGQKLDIDLDKIVPEYYSKNWLVRWLFRKRLHVAIEYIRKIKPNVLIDTGCGDGHFIKLINESNINIREMWAIDLNPSIMQLNNKMKNCTFKIDNVLKTDFPDHIFDAAVSLDMLEHIKDIEKAVTEIRRILRHEGHLITSEPVESALYKSLRFILKGTYSQESGPGAGIHYHNAKQIDDIIQSMGFTRIDSKQIPCRPFDLFHLNLYIKSK